MQSRKLIREATNIRGKSMAVRVKDNKNDFQKNIKNKRNPRNGMGQLW